MRCAAAVVLGAASTSAPEAAHALCEHHDLSSTAPPGTSPRLAREEHLDAADAQGRRTWSANARHACSISGGRGASTSSRAPRPTTARQLCRAALGLDLTSGAVPSGSDHTRAAGHGSDGNSDVDARQAWQGAARAPGSQHAVAALPPVHSACGDDQQAVLREGVGAARLGESTLLLDGVACHRVVICGRILRCIDAGANGSTAATTNSSSAPPFDLLWVSDTSGVVCVWRRRRATEARHRPLSCLAAAAAYGDGGAWPSLLPREWNLLQQQQQHQQRPCAAAVDDVASRRAAALESPPASPGAVTTATPSLHAPCVSDDDGDVDLRVNDYVVCIGSLAFADVDVQVAHALQPYAAALREATWAAATALHVTQHDNGAVTVGAGGRSSPQSFVLLPGSAAPLTVEAARAELGVVGALPASTRFLSAEEAESWDGVADAHNAFSSSAAPPSTTTRAAAVHHASVPLLCIKGEARLVLDVNECLYWWLAAAETHLRLRARKITPTTCPATPLLGD
ncbi:hypothetical protein NESM_000528700 [Novymonas esmeraldas]|uniref:Uncharacterized protein n=1 Tax=Novymonas esmeraldas TaxID=1808958 RepID=A0AAW0EP66_9TRYP